MALPRPLRRHRHRQRSGRRIGRASPGGDGQAHPDARAGRLPAPLARQLGRQNSVCRWRVPGSGNLVPERTARRSIPGCTTGSVATPKVYGSALFRLRERDFGELPHKGGVSPLGRSATTRSSPTMVRPRRFSMCTGCAARIPTSLGRASPTPIAPVSHEPRIQELNDKLAPAWGCIRSICRWASLLDERDGDAHADQARASGATPSTVSLPGQCQGGRAGDLRRPDTAAHPTSRCLQAPMCRARDRRIGGIRRSSVQVTRNGQGGAIFRRYRRRRLRRAKLCFAAPAFGLGCASTGFGERIGPGRVAVHAPRHLAS